MKCLCLSLIGLLLAGCETDQEDRDFFYSGWMHPERASNRRMYGEKGPPPNEDGNIRESLDEPGQLPNQ